MNKSRMIQIIVGVLLFSTKAYALEPVAGCREGDYVEVRGNPAVSIGFEGMSYTPRCLIVKVSTPITMAASRTHPLLGMAPIGGMENPLANSPAATTTKTVIFTQPGQYGYFCETHGNAAGNGMAGAI